MDDGSWDGDNGKHSDAGGHGASIERQAMEAGGRDDPAAW
jgi:hypothetical protein